MSSFAAHGLVRTVDCRGQGLRGLAKRVEADETCAIPVHCFTRCLNVFARSTRQCTITRDSLDSVHDTSKLISNSPNRTLVFSRMSRQLSPDPPGLKPLSNHDLRVCRSAFHRMRRPVLRSSRRWRLWAAVFTFNPYLLISINELLISIIHLLISINMAASIIFIDINK